MEGDAPHTVGRLRSVASALVVRWTPNGWRLAELTWRQGPEPTDAEFGTAPRL